MAPLTTNHPFVCFAIKWLLIQWNREFRYERRLISARMAMINVMWTSHVFFPFHYRPIGVGLKMYKSSERLYCSILFYLLSSENWYINSHRGEISFYAHMTILISFWWYTKLAHPINIYIEIWYLVLYVSNPDHTHTNADKSWGLRW